MAASSSMINTVPEREGWASPGCRMMTTASDIDCLPHQREFEIESRAFAGMTFDPNFSRMLLNNAIRHRKSKSRTFALAFARRGFSGEERVVNAMNVVLRYTAAGIGNNAAYPVALGCRDTQSSACRHGIASIQEQIEKHLLQSSGVAVDEREVMGKLILNVNLVRFDLVLY